jgi:hypothetical protein
MKIKPETLLAELDRLRKDMIQDKGDLEWLAVHHAFCFISYKMTEFRKYVEEQEKAGAFEDFEG